MDCCVRCGGDDDSLNAGCYLTRLSPKINDLVRTRVPVRDRKNIK